MAQLMSPTVDPLQSIGPASVEQLRQIGATPQGALGNDSQAILKALMDKAAKKALEGHFNEKAQEVMDTSPDGAHILTGSLSGNTIDGLLGKTSPSSSTSSPSSPSSDFSVSGGQATETDMQDQVRKNILQQLIQTTKQPQGVLAGFLHGFAQGTGYTKGNLENLNTAATTAGLSQEQAGAKPIQPADIAKMNREVYANTITASNDILARNQEQYKSLVDQYKALEQSKGILDSTFKRPSADQLSLIDQMKAISKQNIEHFDRLRSLVKNAPKALTENKNQAKFKVTKIGQ